VAKITAEMKEMLEKQQSFVATADIEGVPNIGPKGSTAVLDDETLAFAEIVGKKTFENIKVNPKVAVAVVDRGTFSGYRFVGTASMETSGPFFDIFWGKLKTMGIPNMLALVKVKVEEIYDISVKNPGGKIE